MKIKLSLKYWKKALQAAILAVTVCFSLGASDAGTRYDHLNHQLMCSCGCGQVLGECNHVGCPDSPVQLAELRTDINAGMADKQVLDSFSAKYGATVLAAPTMQGFNILAWVAPFAVFAAALLGTILLVRHWSVGTKDATQTASTPEMDEIHERIRRETDNGGDEGGRQ